MVLVHMYTPPYVSDPLLLGDFYLTPVGLDGFSGKVLHKTVGPGLRWRCNLHGQHSGGQEDGPSLC